MSQSKESCILGRNIQVWLEKNIENKYNKNIDGICNAILVEAKDRNLNIENIDGRNMPAWLERNIGI